MNQDLNNSSVFNSETNSRSETRNTTPVQTNKRMRESQYNILDDTPTFTEALKKTTCIFDTYTIIVTHSEGVILRSLWLKFSRSLEHEIPISTFYKLLKSCTNSDCPSALY